MEVYNSPLKFHKINDIFKIMLFPIHFVLWWGTPANHNTVCKPRALVHGHEPFDNISDPNYHIWIRSMNE